MEILEDKELRREIILDNYQNPMNRGLINDTHYIKENTSFLLIDISLNMLTLRIWNF